jgi:hypothetical protein
MLTFGILYIVPMVGIPIVGTILGGGTTLTTGRHHIITLGGDGTGIIIQHISLDTTILGIRITGDITTSTIPYAP